MLSAEDKAHLTTMRGAAMALAELQRLGQLDHRRSDVLHHLQNLCDSAKNVSFDCRASHASLPWKDILALRHSLEIEQRNKAAHGHVTTHFNNANLLQQLERILHTESIL